MSCDKCNSVRIVTIDAKCSDMFEMWYKDEHGIGYVPKNLLFGKGGYGDYVHLAFCLDCGKIQGKFPIPEEEIDVAMNEFVKSEF